MATKLYKVFSILVTVVSGKIAGVLLTRLWSKARREEGAPAASDQERRLREILVAAAVQGALTAVLKAVANRGGAVGMRRMTGNWPA